MTPLDRDRLIKLLNMTASEHDAEALNAIRRSNALLRQSKSTWTDIILIESAPEPADADLFGDEPILSRPASWDSRKSAAKDAARARVRAVPALWRWSFFPIWAFAETYISAVHAEPWPINVISFVAPLAVLGIVGAIWIAIVVAIARAGGLSF